MEEVEDIIVSCNGSANWKIEPPIDIPLLKCKVELAKGVFIYALACDKYLFLSNDEMQTYHLTGFGQNYNKREVIEVEPFFTIENIGTAYHKEIEVNDPNYTYYHYSYNYSYNNNKKIRKTDCYTKGAKYNYDTKCYSKSIEIPFNYLNFSITYFGITKNVEMKFEQPESADTISIKDDNNLNVSIEFFGKVHTFVYGLNENYYNWYGFWNLIQKAEFISTTKDEVIIKYFEANSTNDNLGAEKRKNIKTNLTTLATQEPLLYAFFNFLKNKKVTDKTSNNKLITAVLLDCGHDYEKLKNQLSTVLTQILETQPKEEYNLLDTTRRFCMMFSASVSSELARKAKVEWNLRTGNKAKAEGLGIDENKYKLLMNAIVDGKISTQLFHVVNDPMNLINMEFDLWEKALKPSNL